MREEIIKRIHEERNRQADLPGSEFDMNNGPNDWVAIATRYLAEGSQAKGIRPNASDFEDSLVKAAAIIIAAIEHSRHMKAEKRLR